MDVENYSVEQWSAANLRISHLLDKSSPLSVIADYVEYTTWVADYLECYIHKGLFMMDERHRIWVAH